MTKPQRRYGSIPTPRRRLAVGVCLLLGVVIIIAGLLISWFTDTPVRWGWLMVAVGFAIGFTALYMWIRLSD